MENIPVRNISSSAEFKLALINLSCMPTGITVRRRSVSGMGEKRERTVP